MSEEVPVGYKNIRIYFKIDADLSEEQKSELLQMAQKYSPVFNSIAKPVPVSVHLDNRWWGNCLNDQGGKMITMKMFHNGNPAWVS